MHHNRWAWALAFIALDIAIRPAPRAARDGALPGLLMAALLFIKVTYFAALAPLVIISLLLTRQQALLLVAIATGLFAIGALTLLLGIDYWTAYLGDLLMVAGTEVRAQPGLGLTAILTSPTYLLGAITTFAMVILLRRGGLKNEGLIVLLLLGAGSYVTFQDFGNDPQWLAFLALLLFVWAMDPSAASVRQGILAGAVALTALSAPSYINMTVSPFRHVAINQDAYIPLLAGGARHQDVLVSRIKANRIRANIPLAGAAGFEAPEADAPLLFQGRALPDCRTEPVAGYYASAVADLKARGLAQGETIFAMDILNPYWLYGDLPPLEGGTPWYYADAPGFESADHVLLLSCPILTSVRDLIAKELETAPLTLVAEAPLYTLYRH